MSKETTEEFNKAMLGTYTIETLFDQGKLHDGIKLGMGTGTTIRHVIQAFWHLLKEKGWKDIAVVPTSSDTLYQCYKFNIPVYSLDSPRIAGHLDLCIDGADRFDTNKNLIKGGGAALFREKIVAYNSDIFAVVAEQKKEVENLNCDFPIPIEIFPFAYKSVCLSLEKRGITYKLREGRKDGTPLITENGNYILDAYYPKAFTLDPTVEEIELNKIVGVIENGFFSKEKVTGGIFTSKNK